MRRRKSKRPSTAVTPECSKAGRALSSSLPIIWRRKSNSERKPDDHNMKIAIIVVRMLMGLMFLFASIVVLFNLMPHPEMKGNAKLFMDGLMATGYFMTLLKCTELVCGLAFVTGLFVPLA